MAMTIDSLIALDQELLTWFNGSESLFLDNFVVLLTTGITWIPLYVALFVLVMKNNEAMSQIMLVVGCAALCILFADGVADGLVKPLVGRPRPCNDPLLKYAVDIAGNYRVSGFSFFSAHAANTMSIAVFFTLLVRNRTFTAAMLLWSLLNGWTRLYLGLHYPCDVLCGFLWGAVSGCLAYLLFYKLQFFYIPFCLQKKKSIQHLHTFFSVIVIIKIFLRNFCDSAFEEYSVHSVDFFRSVVLDSKNLP